METNKNVIVFLDAIGRTIFAEKDVESTTKDELVVFNPVVVDTRPNPQTGQLAIQLFPIFFKEFLADKDAKMRWKYNRKLIVEDIDQSVFDIKLYLQYSQMFAPLTSQSNIQSPQSQQLDQPVKDNIIKLFDK